MAEIIKITQAKYDELTARLKALETTEREKISLAIKEAKEHGDLSENAEYSAAKDAQVQNESEIARITETLRQATVIDESTISTKSVAIGTVVTLLDLNENEEIEYTIVSTLEANSRKKKISDVSPIGKALIGHKKGETVTAVTPAGSLELKILNITK